MSTSISHPTNRPNFTRVVHGDLTIWFSYTTPIGFRKGYDGPTIVRENEWGPTTGKHLNELDNGNKTHRLAGHAFTAMLQAAENTAEV